MKKNYPLRIGIYETNSSSSHSFSMGVFGRLAGKLPMNRDKVIRVSTSDWQHGGVKFNESLYKLSYLLCYIYSSSSDQINDGGVWVKRGYKEEFEVVADVVKNFTGAKEVIIDNSKTELDSQSLGIIDYRDLKDPDFIKEFIFNPGTWVYAVWDWDIYNLPEDFYENPEMPVLYTIVFDELPGKPALHVRYGETTKVFFMISKVLDKYVWSGEKFYWKSSRSKPAGCVGWSGEGLKFGDKETKISIIL